MTRRTRIEKPIESHIEYHGALEPPPAALPVETCVLTGEPIAGHYVINIVFAGAEHVWGKATAAAFEREVIIRAAIGAIPDAHRKLPGYRRFKLEGPEDTLRGDFDIEKFSFEADATMRRRVARAFGWRPRQDPKSPPSAIASYLAPCE